MPGAFQHAAKKASQRAQNATHGPQALGAPEAALARPSSGMRVVDQRSVGLNSAMGAAGEHVNRNRTIINLAYEGVPQRAIARALQLPANEVGEVVAGAVARGIIVRPSESEWPQGSRAPRHPSFAGPPVDEARLLIAATQSLALTKTQAALFLALVRRKFCTKEILHDIVESRRWAHSTPTDRKIVGVMICSIRKRLKGRYIIQTVQGSGYFIQDDDRRRAAEHLLGCIGVAADDAAVKKLTGNLKLPAAEPGNRKEACSVKRPDRRAPVFQSRQSSAS